MEPDSVFPLRPKPFVLKHWIKLFLFRFISFIVFINGELIFAQSDRSRRRHGFWHKDRRRKGKEKEDDRARDEHVDRNLVEKWRTVEQRKNFSLNYSNCDMKALKSPFIPALFSRSIGSFLYLPLVDSLPLDSSGICPFVFHCLVCSMRNFLWQFISGSLGISLHFSNVISFRIFVSFLPENITVQR